MQSHSKNGGLDQYGAEPFEQHQFGTAGIEEIKLIAVKWSVVYCEVSW